MKARDLQCYAVSVLQKYAAKFPSMARAYLDRLRARVRYNLESCRCRRFPQDGRRCVECGNSKLVCQWITDRMEELAT